MLRNAAKQFEILNHRRVDIDLRRSSDLHNCLCNMSNEISYTGSSVCWYKKDISKITNSERWVCSSFIGPIDQT